jgi:hypothetical protein
MLSIRYSRSITNTYCDFLKTGSIKFINSQFCSLMAGKVKSLFSYFLYMNMDKRPLGIDSGTLANARLLVHLLSVGIGIDYSGSGSGRGGWN